MSQTLHFSIFSLGFSCNFEQPVFLWSCRGCMLKMSAIKNRHVAYPALWMTRCITDIPEVTVRSKCCVFWSSAIDVADSQKEPAGDYLLCSAVEKKSSYSQYLINTTHAVTSALPPSLIICFPVEEMSYETLQHMLQTHSQSYWLSLYPDCLRVFWSRNFEWT